MHATPMTASPGGPSRSERKDTSTGIEHVYDSRMDEHQTTAAESGLTSVPLGRQQPDLRPPEHDRVCWAAAIGGARRLIPLEGWDAAEQLAAQRLRDGQQDCICSKRKGRHRGRRQR